MLHCINLKSTKHTLGHKLRSPSEKEVFSVTKGRRIQVCWNLCQGQPGVVISWPTQLVLTELAWTTTDMHCFPAYLKNTRAMLQ